MNSINSKKHIALLILCIGIWSALGFLVGFKALSAFTTVGLVTPFFGLIHSSILSSSIQAKSRFSPEKQFAFIIASGLAAFLAPVIIGAADANITVIDNLGKYIKNYSEFFYTLYYFSAASILGSIFYLLVINKLTPLSPSFGRSVLVCTMSLFCLIPVAMHYNFGRNPTERILDSEVFFLEPAFWWIGVSLGLLIPPNKDI